MQNQVKGHGQSQKRNLGGLSHPSMNSQQGLQTGALVPGQVSEKQRQKGTEFGKVDVLNFQFLSL